MTKRAVIITTSIIAGLVAIFTILFGVVFRVKNIKVVHAEDFVYQVKSSEIISTSKLRKNASIFSVPRETIASNIEKAYPYARANVNIDSLTSVKITLSNRTPLYYLVEDGKYYILDEDCKILESCGNDSSKAMQYILLNNVFSISESAEAGDFVDGQYTGVCTSLYKSMYTNAVLNIGEDADSDGYLDEKHLNRQDMINIIRSVKVMQVNELNGKVDKLILTTSYGVKISIIEPQKDLGYKINSTFSALRELIARGQGEETSGTIQLRYSYDENNHIILKLEYVAD